MSPGWLQKARSHRLVPGTHCHQSSLRNNGVALASLPPPPSGTVAQERRRRGVNNSLLASTNDASRGVHPPYIRRPDVAQRNPPAEAIKRTMVGPRLSLDENDVRIAPRIRYPLGLPAHLAIS